MDEEVKGHLQVLPLAVSADEHRPISLYYSGCPTAQSIMGKRVLQGFCWSAEPHKREWPLLIGMVADTVVPRCIGCETLGVHGKRGRREHHLSARTKEANMLSCASSALGVSYSSTLPRLSTITRSAVRMVCTR